MLGEAQLQLPKQTACSGDTAAMNSSAGCVPWERATTPPCQGRQDDNTIPVEIFFFWFVVLFVGFF